MVPMERSNTIPFSGIQMEYPRNRMEMLMSLRSRHTNLGNDYQIDLLPYLFISIKCLFLVVLAQCPRYLPLTLSPSYTISYLIVFKYIMLIHGF